MPRWIIVTLAIFGATEAVALLGSLFYDRSMQKCLDNLTTAEKQAMFESKHGL